MGTSTDGGPITPYLGSWAYTCAADRAGHHYYRCFHRKGVIDVRARDLLDAREQAARHWRLGKRAYEASAVLIAKFDPEHPPLPVPVDPASL